MARRSASDTAKTRDDILQYASKSFRKHGSAVGIGEVMSGLGLTRGGFYRHFASKDDLLVEAIAQGFNQVADRLDRIAQAAEPGTERAAIIGAYMSEEHLKHPETWCALASLAPDIARQSATVREKLDGAMLGYMQKMTRYMPGATPQQRTSAFVVLFSGMAGAMAMVRAMGDKQMRRQVLKSTRDYYLETFG